MMDRPRIICHILQSVDGNIDGDFFTVPEIGSAYRAFSRIREEFACDAVISGATTAAEIYRGGFIGILPQASERWPRTDRKAASAEKYAVVIDGTGDLRWESGNVERRGEKLHVIVVLQGNASDAYISHLRKAGVSYIFAGKDGLDLPLAARKLKELFGIESMLLSGGGVVDWSFLQAGLIDEISLVIPPVIDGGVRLPSAFDDSPLAVGHAPVALHLADVQRLEGDTLWLCDYHSGSFFSGVIPPAEIPPDPGQGPRHYETGSHRNRHTVGVLLRMAQSVEHLPDDRRSLA